MNLMNVEEVAEMIRVSEKTIYQMVYRGTIPAIKVSHKCLRFRRSDIEAWLDSKAVEPKPTGKEQKPRPRQTTKKKEEV
jgi:excisionase family DNA binding protein